MTRKHTPLTPRELEVMSLTANGFSAKDISRILKIEETTIKDRKRAACLKLNAVNSTHAAALLAASGEIDVDPV